MFRVCFVMPLNHIHTTYGRYESRKRLTIDDMYPDEIAVSQYDVTVSTTDFAVLVEFCERRSGLLGARTTTILNVEDLHIVVTDLNERYAGNGDDDDDGGGLCTFVSVNDKYIVVLGRYRLMMMMIVVVVIIIINERPLVFVRQTPIHSLSFYIAQPTELDARNYLR